MRAPALAWFLILAIVIGLTPVICAAPAPSPPADPVREAIVQALATGGDVPGQARNLVGSLIVPIISKLLYLSCVHTHPRIVKSVA